MVRVGLRQRRRRRTGCSRSCRSPGCWSSPPACRGRSSDRDFDIVFVGYLVMRVGLVTLWLRAARYDPGARRDRAPLRGRRVACAWSGGVAAGAARLAGAGRSSCSASPSCAVPVWAERGGAHPVAPRAHRRALRPVHDHRARRDHPLVVDRVPGGGRRADRRRHRCTHRGRCPAHRVLDVVDLLRQAGRVVAGVEPVAFPWGYGHYVVFARRRGRRGGRRGGGGPGDRARAPARPPAPRRRSRSR